MHIHRGAFFVKRGAVLASCARDWIVEIEDVSDFVAAERPHAGVPDWPDLATPREDAYPIADAAVAQRLRADPWP